MRDIDLSIALKKYEQIQTEKAKAEVQVILVETQSGNNEEREKEIDQLRDRVSRLDRYASKIKQEMLEMSKAVAVAQK